MVKILEGFVDGLKFRDSKEEDDITGERYNIKEFAQYSTGRICGSLTTAGLIGATIIGFLNYIVN